METLLNTYGKNIQNKLIWFYNTSVKVEILQRFTRHIHQPRQNIFAAFFPT